MIGDTLRSLVDIVAYNEKELLEALNRVLSPLPSFKKISSGKGLPSLPGVTEFCPVGTFPALNVDA
jgi:hypothetical protein